MRAGSVFSLTVFSLLTILVQAPALAQQVPGACAVTYEERHRVAGWEEPLCSRDNNLRHYYWTEIDASSRYRANVINRVAPVGHGYRVIKRVSDLNAKPNVVTALSAKGHRLQNQIASNDVSAVLKNRAGGGSGSRGGAGAFTYASYSYNNSPSYGSSSGNSSSANVKGRVLSY